MGGGRQGEPSTAAMGGGTGGTLAGNAPVYDEDLSFVPEEFYDEHVNRAEQNKELGELRAESIPVGRVQS